MDRTLEDTFYILFTTRAFATGIPTTLAGTPVVSAYEDNSLTQITAGITLGVDHDGVTGLNLLTIVATAANGYGAGQDYNLVITTGTVDSVSVVGEVVGSFSLGLSSAFKRLGAPAGASVSADTAAIKAETALIVADTNELQTDDVPGLIAALNDVAATDIVSAGAITTLAGAVVNVDTVDTTTTNTDMRGTDSAATAANLATAQADLDILTGTDGATLATAQGNYAPSKAGDAMTLTAAATSAQLVDDVLDEALSGHITAGTLGKAVADIETDATAILADTADMQPKLGTPAADVSADIAAVKAETALIVADTNELQVDWANGGRLDVILDAVLAMIDDARGEPAAGAPPVNPDLATKIDYLYKWTRNKKDNNGTTTNFYADDGSTVDHTQAVSSAAGTVTKGEIGA